MALSRQPVLEPKQEHGGRPDPYIGSELAEHLSNFVRKRSHRKRLCENLHTGFEMPISNSGILCKPGYEEYLQTRSRYTRGICELTPVHVAGQTNIRDQQINLLR
jgi:hypothetical protein